MKLEQQPATDGLHMRQSVEMRQPHNTSERPRSPQSGVAF
jgi:hypothetical protein